MSYKNFNFDPILKRNVMSTKFQLRFSELLCSRICHDLISPISAINNGVEMLNDGDESILPHSLELIENCAQHSLDRLSFYRIAYGSGGEGSKVNWSDIQRILEVFSADRKTEVIWEKKYKGVDEHVPRVLAKLLANVFYLASECLPRGGVIYLRNLETDSSNSLLLQLEGPICKLRDDVGSGLCTDVAIEELSVKNIFVYLLVLFTSSLDRSLEIRNISVDKIEVSIS